MVGGGVDPNHRDRGYGREALAFICIFAIAA
jgi:hypothetical protein